MAFFKKFNVKTKKCGKSPSTFKERKTESIAANFLIRFLPTKHRTSKVIDQFVAGTIREKGDLIKRSSASETLKLDYHLEDRNLYLPPGQKPIWISLHDSNFEEIKMKLQELTQDCGEILAISKFQYEKFIKFCSMMNWKFANADDKADSVLNPTSK